jgi:hypothetical protein
VPSVPNKALGVSASYFRINMSGFLPIPSTSSYRFAKTRLRNLAEKHSLILSTASNHPDQLPLTMADADWRNPVWDSIPAYHLTKESVDSFLQGIFGYYDFYTRVSATHRIDFCPLGSR